MKLSFENVTDYPETQNTLFRFTGKSGVIRNKENIIVGFFTIDYDDGDTLNLEELEILDQYQNQGYGKSFIENLLLKYPNVESIEGNSLEESVDFYTTIGAEIKDSCESCSYTACAIHPNHLEEEDDENCDDYCDDYSDRLFILKRDVILK